MLSSTIQELKTTSTERILTALNHSDDDIQELPCDDMVIAQQEVHIPDHFQSKARDIIKKLLASNLYTLTGSSTEVFTWVSKVKPFSIKFSYPHPSVVTLDSKPQVFHQVITNIDAQGKINYQVQTFDGSLHYIDVVKIPYLALQLNHTNIVGPHLEILAEEEHSKSKSGKSSELQVRPPRLSF
jgi:hypothetical protein